MNHPIRFPVFAQDQAFLNDLSKKLCARIRKAAGLGKEFAPLHRQSTTFLAKGFGAESDTRLFGGEPPRVKPGLTRAMVRSQFQSAVERAVLILADEQQEKLSVDQLRSIAKALPSILDELRDELKKLVIDQYTFERQTLDAVLVASGAPKYEFAIIKPHRQFYDLRVFIFEDAREAVTKIAGEYSAAALAQVSKEQIAKALHECTYPLIEVLQKRQMPPNHLPVVLADKDGNVVGVSYQHPVHHGIVPVCCENVERFWLIAESLYEPTQAHMRHSSSNNLHYFDPTVISPFYPHFPFTTTRRQEHRDGPPVYFKQVGVDDALEYLTALSGSVNDQRVRCKENDLELLASATLNSSEIIQGGSGTRRRYWGLESVQNAPGQSKVMSASGTSRGITGKHQWYLRQTKWVDAATLPELAMPSSHFLAQEPDDNDQSKIIPDGTDDFIRQATEQLQKMSGVGKRDIAQKLQEQEKQLWKIRAALQREEEARAQAFEARLTAVGPEVLAPA